MRKIFQKDNFSSKSVTRSWSVSPDDVLPDSSSPTSAKIREPPGEGADVTHQYDTASCGKKLISQENDSGDGVVRLYQIILKSV